MNLPKQIGFSALRQFKFAIFFFFSALSIAPLFVRADSFSWLNVDGYSYVTPVKNQGSSGMCWAFAAVGMMEAKYKITRDDPTYNVDLSEQQLADSGVGNWASGGGIVDALNYCKSTGLVTEAELPFQTSVVTPWPGWPLATGWENRLCKIDATSAVSHKSADIIKNQIKNYGPVGAFIYVDEDWYDPSPGTTAASHMVLITGYVDDDSAPGKGYFIVKNSWGSTWNGNGYAKISYSTMESRTVYMITGSAYFTGPLQTVTWDTSSSSGYQAGSGTWSTSSGKWSSNGTTLAVWRNGEDAAVFDGGGGSYAVNVDYNLSAHSLTFNSGASGYTLTGGKLTVTTGGITVNENVTMNTGLTAGGDQTWTVASGKLFTVNANVNTHISALTVNCIGDTIIKGAVSDIRGNSRWDGLLTDSHGSLTKSGSGTLTLCGNNTYTGDTTITAGTIKLGASAAGLSEGRIDTYFDTSTSNPAASIQLSPTKANSAIGANQTYLYTGYINNSSSSDVTWYFAENYNGVVELLIDGNKILYNTGSAAQSLNSCTLASGLHSFELRMSSSSATSTGVSGTGAFGTGLGIAYSTDGGNTYQALADPGDGSLFRVSSTDGGTLSPASTVVMSSDTTLDLNNFSTSVGALADADAIPTGHRVLLGSGTLTIAGNVSSTSFSGAISGTGGLIKTGTATQTLTGTNTFQGGTFFNGGYIAAASLDNLGSGNLTFNGGGLLFGGVFDPTLRNLTINSGGASFDTNGYTILFANALTGSGGVTKAGSGTLVYNTACTYSGDTTITAGTLKAAAANAVPSGSGKGNLSVACSATLDMGGYNQTMNGLSGYGAVDNTSGSSNYTLSVGGNNADSQFYGAIKNTSGIVSLNKIGTGTLIINGYENSYSGDTLISGGTIKLGATGIGLYEGSINTYLDLATANPRNAIQLTTVKANTAIGYNVTWVYSGYINNSGSSSATWTFAEHYLDAVSLLIDGVQVLYSTTSALTKGTYTLTPGLHGFELRLAGNSSGNNGVYSTGVHSTGLGVAYSTDGGTTYLALTDPGDGSLFHLSNSAGGSLPLSSAVVMASNTTLDLSDYSLTIGSLADADGTPAGHRVLLGSGTLTLGGNNKSTTFSGIISGTGSLIKTGSGTFTLAGANAYTGATMITSGTLKLVDGGSIAGGVIDVYAGVFDVSSLSGYSLSAGKTIKGNGSIIGSLTVLGTIAPGDSAGILNTADVTFGNGSLLSIELAGNAAGEFDVLNSSGTITLLSGSELILSLIGGYIPNRGDSFDILNFTSLSGEFTVTDLPTLSNGYYWDTDNLYTTGVITLVPEPAELIMLIAAFAALGIWSRIGKCRR